VYLKIIKTLEKCDKTYKKSLEKCERKEIMLIKILLGLLIILLLMWLGVTLYMAYTVFKDYK